MKDIRIPKVGMSTVEVEIVEILVKVGDHLEAGDLMMQVAADKVDIDIAAESAGTVREILAEVDQEVKVGDIVARFEED